MQYYNEEKLIIKSWCNNPDDGAIRQARNLANLPFAFKSIVLMPDTHQGYGMPIGGVLATKDVVVPNAVGVDIGCGMCTVKTNLKDLPVEKLKSIMGLIREYVPVGTKHHSEPQDASLLPVADLSELHIVNIESKNSLYQIGTLGGGNHFLEIQADEDGHVWIMIHSGSRNIGKQVADYYNKKAVELNQMWHSSIPDDWGLAFLPIKSEYGKAYLKEMKYCVDFAFANRKLMMDNSLKAFHEVMGEFESEPIINIAHNYARFEQHFGKNVIVHRKGATSARLDEIGIIPGSQGTSSYIVKGKGNKESFESCSHGAGRKMSRTQAINTLNLESEMALLDNLGIIHAVRGQQNLEEAPSAYKDIDVVMEEQKDLVDILVKLRPLGVVKG
jgi:tRNA-splicing ligase RtcB